MGVSAASLPESHQGSEVGSQHCPAEGCHGVDSHQAADEGVLAALEQGHNVRTHVVSVLLSEVLNEAEMCMQMLLRRNKHLLTVCYTLILTFLMQP